MPKRVVTIEGEVVPDEMLGRPALDTGEGWPLHVGGIFDDFIKEHVGERVRITMDVIAVRNTAKWKKV